MAWYNPADAWGGISDALFGKAPDIDTIVSGTQTGKQKKLMEQNMNNHLYQ